MGTKTYLQRIAELTTTRPEVPAEDLALRLHDEAARLFGAAQELRYLAQQAQGLAKESMVANADRFEGYAVHLGLEAGRLLGTMSDARLKELRFRILEEARRLTDVEMPLPYATPEELS